jgi:hypothetical protein
MNQKRSWCEPPPPAAEFWGIVNANLFILRPFFEKDLGLIKKDSVSGWDRQPHAATLTPQPEFAAPAITLKASFHGANGYSLYAPLTPAGNGLFYGTTYSVVIIMLDPSLNLIPRPERRCRLRLEPQAAAADSAGAARVPDRPLRRVQPAGGAEIPSG